MLVEGCEKCWKKANYEGPVPQLIAAEDSSKDVTKKALREMKKVAERDTKQAEETAATVQNRYTVLDQRLEILKSKEPLKRALHAMIRQINSRNMTELELFNEIDQDGNGELERGEITAGLRKLGVKLLPIELDSILRTIDQDGSGTIDFQEFYYLIKTEGDCVLGGKQAAEDDVNDRLGGFNLGQRVRVKVALWTEKERQRRNQPDYDPENDMLGTVQGPGMKAGSILVKCDWDSQLVSLKPKHIEALTAEQLKAHPATCICHACLGLASTDDEDD